jgi:hypothetical protein
VIHRRQRHLPARGAVALLVAAAVLAGCASYSGTAAQKVQQWVSQNSFVANHDQLVSDITLVDKAVKGGSAKVVRTICGGLASDAGTAYTTLPTPDPTLTNDLNDADTAAANASTSCSGVSSLTSPTMQADLALFRAAIADLAKAQARLAQLGVNWKIHL